MLLETTRMFTGLIETIGTVVSTAERGGAAMLGIRPDSREFTAAVGASVAVDGACLTVERLSGDVLYFTAVRETMQRTTLAGVRPGAGQP